MKKFAVLIDADNASYKNIEMILKEIEIYGKVTVKRAYGDWGDEKLKSWKKELLIHAIKDVQQSAHTVNKNATDIKLVIDTMDLLYKEDLDGFCIISSDSDFTPLASRIREEGLLCYGFGKKKNTAEPFTLACDKFIYVEDLQPQKKTEIQSKIVAKPTKKVITKTKNLPRQEAQPKSQSTQKNDAVKIGKATLNLFYKAIENNSDNENWAHLGSVGSYIKNIRHDFNVKNYGKKTLTELVKSIPTLTTKVKGKQVYVKKTHSMPLKKQESKHQAVNPIQKVNKTPKAKKNIMEDKATLDLIYMAIANYSNNATGWANLGTIEAHIKNEQPSIDTRIYDKEALLELIKNLPDIEIKTDQRYIRKSQSNNITQELDTQRFFKLVYDYSMGYGEWIPVIDIKKKINKIHWDIRSWDNNLQSYTTVTAESLKQTDIIAEIKNLSPEYITLDEKQEHFKLNQKPK